MSKLTRKQREIAEREAKILDLARSMLVEHGYHGLSMDRIAEALEYSKGTIYQHFSCKEEILLALANAAHESRLRLFRRAALHRGGSRERMMAIGIACELFVKKFPHHFHVEQVVRLSSAWEKTSQERRSFMQTCEMACMEIVGGITRDAIISGDLILPERIAPEHLVFGLWAMSYGAYSIFASSPSLSEIGLDDPQAALGMNYDRLLDGYGWRPLSSEFDYPALADHLRVQLQNEPAPAEVAV